MRVFQLLQTACNRVFWNKEHATVSEEHDTVSEEYATVSEEYATVFQIQVAGR